MQYPPSGQDWPSQEQPPYGYGQPSQPLPSNPQWGSQAPSQPLPPNTQWGQQPYPPQQGQWQQPYGQPPPQQYPPMYQPPRQPKKKSKLPIIIGVVVVLVVFACIGSALASKGGATSTTSTDTTTQSTQQPTTVPTTAPTPTPTTAPTPTPTPKPMKWTTVQTFTGNGNKKTAIFDTSDDWKIIWSCNPSSFYGGEYNLIVSVYASDGSDIDLAAINTICKAGNTNDLTEEHQGGQVYLDIASEGAWTIQIQELK